MIYKTLSINRKGFLFLNYKKSYIWKLSKAQSDQLYETVFEIIDDIANIDCSVFQKGTLLMKLVHQIRLKFNTMVIHYDQSLQEVYLLIS